MRWIAAASAVALVAVGGWLWLAGDGQLALNDVYARLDEHFPLSEDPLNLSAHPPFDGSFEATVEDLVWREAATSKPVGIDLDSHEGHDAAVYRFAAGRGGRISGLLVVMDAGRVSDPPAATVPTRQHSRYDPRPQVAWTKGGRVYVCIIERGTLDGLQREMYGGTA